MSRESVALSCYFFFLTGFAPVKYSAAYMRLCGPAGPGSPALLHGHTWFVRGPEAGGRPTSINPGGSGSGPEPGPEPAVRVRDCVALPPCHC